MNELKLTEIAPYLPYGLKAEMLMYKSDYVGKQYDTIVGIHQWDKSGSLWCALTVGGSKPGLDDIKPILRPLSDLTRVIEHDEEKFTPIDRLEYKYGYLGFNTKTPIIDQAGYHAIQTLLSWHMDLFSLIPRNLAVDYNTVNQNV